MALKFLLTFLRAGALARLEWKWISRKDNLLVIPGTTPGLKRTKRTENLPHHVTDQGDECTAEAGKADEWASPLRLGPVRETADTHIWT